MHSTLYPAAKIDEAFKNNLHEYSIMPESVAYRHVMNNDSHWLEPYWGENASFNDSEVLLYFTRFYYGHPKGKESYIEFNQLVTHPLDLHWSPNKNAYCATNDMGEEVEKIKIINTDEVGLVLIRRRSLDKLLHLGKWILLRYFDFDRWRGENPPFEEFESRLVEFNEFQGKFEIRTCGKGKIEYSEFRGVQILRPSSSKEELLSWRFYDEEEKEYATFIVYDWKNNKVLEDYLIDPKNFSNYFIESNLPFETSRIFFNAEVLDKYKGNPDKYDLKERKITCHGGWFLETFDINEYNQVHTYAIYLSRLPYREQLHWKQYNEKPNGSISKRAWQTDFEAQFSEPSKLDILRQKLEKLNNIKFANNIGPIWSPKGGSWEMATKGLFYLKTENPNQWHDFIIALANTVNEGFQKATLAKIAAHYGNRNEQLGTLSLLKFIINNTGNKESLEKIYGILNDLQRRRSKGKAHGVWDSPESSLIEDSEKRLSEVIGAIEQLELIFLSLDKSRD